ncbi:MAG: hypothetical protein OXR84_10630 [Magnetovibrio sp.]|nr:hypothetical protein [Magnetovibrio sp.]
MAVKTIRWCLPVALAAALWAGADAPARAADNFQFMKATENRVWRLNKETGEVAVCTLQGERLICTTSKDAATPPPKSYAEMKAAEKARRDKQHDKDMAILDRIFAFFKELITLSKDQEAGQ